MFSVAAWLVADPMAMFVLFSGYVLLMSVGKTNPLAPLLLWAFVVPISVLLFRVYPHPDGEVIAGSAISAKGYLLVAPWVHYGKYFDSFSFMQFLPRKIERFGLAMLGFRRYLVVSKWQYSATLLGLRTRGITVRPATIEQFVTTLVVNIGRHSFKYADALELRGLDRPRSMASRPSVAVLDSLIICMLFALFFAVYVLCILQKAS
jgi:hypothetical protein